MRSASEIGVLASPANATIVKANPRRILKEDNHSSGYEVGHEGDAYLISARLFARLANRELIRETSMKILVSDIV